MEFDMNDDFFVSKIKDCAEVLSQEDLDQLQGLIKKVEIFKPRNSEYIVISKADTPKLFDIVKSLTEPFYGKKELKGNDSATEFLKKTGEQREKLNKLLQGGGYEMTTLDLSKCRTKEDVEKVFKENEESLSMGKKALRTLQRQIRD